ncbi:MAG TPA: 2OG-Fe(II) oxygenase [Candidatus Sulfotelmatobacter sp.]|nr:2OG-Fe(II) oxygenase [Candidatus Sulfotelmatobacter sp.]
MSVLGETFTFDLEGLMWNSDKLKAEFLAGRPFPHLVLEDFLSADALAEAIACFPKSDDRVWSREDFVAGGLQVSLKKACNEELRMPVPIRRILRELNSTLFLRWLSSATGIADLMPDASFHGSGMFLIEPGGYLNVHADFNVHFVNKLDRRLNLLLYLNPDWREEYGGHLELWQPGVPGPVKSILPVANRCVIFATSSQSFHGHPKPLACPPGRSRNCLSVYYYTNGRPEAERTPAHETIWTPNPHLR